MDIVLRAQDAISTFLYRLSTSGYPPQTAETCNGMTNWMDLLGL